MDSSSLQNHLLYRCLSPSRVSPESLHLGGGMELLHSTDSLSSYFQALGNESVEISLHARFSLTGHCHDYSTTFRTNRFLISESIVSQRTSPDCAHIQICFKVKVNKQTKKQT
ncbi:hypothetical protein Bca4012_013282 [Brassica carinata]